VSQSLYGGQSLPPQRFAFLDEGFDAFQIRGPLYALLSWIVHIQLDTRSAGKVQRARLMHRHDGTRFADFRPFGAANSRTEKLDISKKHLLDQ
jgi:hypothetical protein